MKATIKNQWIENLRSGRFSQGAGRLRTLDNKYCCLGVLCETLRENGMDAEWGEPEGDGTAKYFNPPSYKIIVPTELGEVVKSLATLSDPLLEIAGMPDELQWKLMSLNDSQGQSFNQIADWIQDNIIPDPELPDAE